MKADQTIIIGLDGAHFEILQDWLDEGLLPNIEELLSQSTTADLISVLPPVTSPNWKAYATGKNPGKLGIFWWENIDTETQQVYYPHDRKHQHRSFWDYLGEEGKTVFIHGVPLTYPPQQVNGIMITGGPDTEESGFTYPKNIEKRLKKEYDYITSPTSVQDDKEQALKDIYHMIETKFTVTRDLIDEEDYDLVQTTTFYLNVLQHFFWDGEETLEGWKIVDKYIGELKEKENTNILIVSDHGSNAVSQVFNINTWLAKEGYLTPKKNLEVSKTLSDIGVSKQGLRRLLRQLGIFKLVRALTPQKIVNMLPSEEGEITNKAKTDKIDWQESDAFASGQGPVYILNQDKKDEIKQKLEDLTAPNGQKVARNVVRKEEIYEGPYMEEAPDLVINQNANIHIRGGLGRDNIFEQPKDWKGENKREGMFVATGPDFNEDVALDQVSILDIAPTVLALYGIETPEELDGEVLTELFAERPNVGSSETAGIDF